MAEDYLIRQIQAATGGLLKILTGKEPDKEEYITETSLSEVLEDILYKKILCEKIEAMKINEAEDYLFSLIEDNKLQQTKEMIQWFYTSLKAIPPSLLEKADFSVDEIKEGKADAIAYITYYSKKNK